MSVQAEARRLQLKRAFNDFRNAERLKEIYQIFEGAAIRIGRFGWWNGQTVKPQNEDAPCCLWLAVTSELERFDYQRPELREQCVVIVMNEMQAHFGVRTMREVFDLNDKQPEHEGQGWAIYHLNAIALEFKARHGLK